MKWLIAWNAVLTVALLVMLVLGLTQLADRGSVDDALAQTSAYNQSVQEDLRDVVQENRDLIAEDRETIRTIIDLIESR